jgi:hypothetical protein
VGFQVEHPLLSFPDLFESFYSAFRELHRYPQHAPEVLASIEAILSDGSVITIPRDLHVHAVSRFATCDDALDWLESDTIQKDPLKRLHYPEINFNLPVEHQVRQLMEMKRYRLHALSDHRSVSKQVHEWLRNDYQAKPNRNSTKR